MTNTKEVATATIALSDNTLGNLIALANTVFDCSDQLEKQVWNFRAEAGKIAKKGSEQFISEYSLENAADKRDVLGAVTGIMHDASVHFKTLSAFYTRTTDIRQRAVNFYSLNLRAGLWEALDYVLSKRDGGSPASESLHMHQFAQTERSDTLNEDSLERVVALGERMADCSKQLEQELLAVRCEAYQQLDKLAKDFVQQRNLWGSMKAHDVGYWILDDINVLTRHISVLNKLWKNVIDVRMRSERFGSLQNSGNLWEAFSRVLQNREPDPDVQPSK